MLKGELKVDNIGGKDAERLLERRDEYVAENVVCILPEPRWAKLRATGNRTWRSQ